MIPGSVQALCLAGPDTAQANISNVEIQKGTPASCPVKDFDPKRAQVTRLMNESNTSCSQGSLPHRCPFGANRWISLVEEKKTPGKPGIESPLFSTKTTKQDTYALPSVLPSWLGRCIGAYAPAVSRPRLSRAATTWAEREPRATLGRPCLVPSSRRCGRYTFKASYVFQVQLVALFFPGSTQWLMDSSHSDESVTHVMLATHTHTPTHTHTSWVVSEVASQSKSSPVRTTQCTANAPR